MSGDHLSGDHCGIVLREAGPLDAGVIAGLHLQCFADGLGGTAWNAASIGEVLSLPGSYAYLAAAAPEPAAAQDRAVPLAAVPLPAISLAAISLAAISLAAVPLAVTPLPAGFLLARILAGESEILSLGVATPWRRHGAARALLRAAVERAGLAGAARTLLEVAEDNRAARGLYATEGFAVVKRWPRYYQRPGGAAVAALVFARELS